MSTQGGLGYRPALDGLRGIAVVLVILQHAWVPGLDRAGGVGVTMFFVLSGFLITTLLLEEHGRSGRVDLPAFYLRRARRLLPAVAVFLVVMAIVGFSLVVIASAALYVSNWLFALAGSYDPLVHLWTLSVEEQFYIVWPLLLIVLLQVPRRWMVGVLVVAMLASTAGRTASALAGDPYWWTYFATHLRADALIAGCLLAIVGRTWMPSRPLVALAVAMIAFAVLIADRDGHAVVGIPLAIAGSVVLVALAAQTTPRSLSWRPLVYVGTISYGLYLWHRPMTWWVNEQGAGWLVMLGAIALAVLVAAVSRRWIEAPFLRRRSVRQDHLEPLRLDARGVD